MAVELLADKHLRNGPVVTKLIIQIPCFNEETTLPETLADLPREIPGVDCVEWLIVDDGSTDDTMKVARQHGVDHIVRHRRNRGLAFAFRSAIDASLRLGADVIVNTDADNQYCGADIAKLVQPILDQQADIVIGDRQTESIEHFSRSKKLLQKSGSRVVRALSGTDIPDAVSGFRAFSRDAAIQLNIVSSFSYTTESLIQMGRERFAVTSVPIRTNPKTRESRLFRSIPQFLRRSAVTILRAYLMYHPLKVFLALSMFLTVLAVVPIVRLVIDYLAGGGQGHLHSLILAGALMTMGFISFLFGSLADLVSRNRQLLEMTLAKVRRLELSHIDESQRNSLQAHGVDSLERLSTDDLFSNIHYQIESAESLIAELNRTEKIDDTDSQSGSLFAFKRK